MVRGRRPGGFSTVGGGNAVVDDLYRETSENRGTVGGVTTDILSMFMV